MPDVYLRRKLYQELGGYPGYRKTPVREILECRLSIIAETRVQHEQMEAHKREMDALKRKQGQR